MSAYLRLGASLAGSDVIFHICQELQPVELAFDELYHIFCTEVTCKGIIVGYSQDFKLEPIGNVDFILIQEHSFLFVLPPQPVGLLFTRGTY
jgi:hypothetical protein